MSHIKRGLRLRTSTSEYNFDQNEFSKLIAKSSDIQVVNVNNQVELKKYLKKNLIDDEMVICMGAGTISNWIREISASYK